MLESHGMQLVGIGLGGFVGAISRYLMLTSVYHAFGRNFPYGTLAVNVIGSLLIGFLYVMFTEKWLDLEAFKLPILVGVLGSFTTFSTFSMDTFQLIEQGQIVTAASYIFMSVSLCLCLTWLGTVLARL